MALGALLPLLVLFLSATPTHQQPSIRGSVEDLYAYPRFRVSFLNGYPIGNETAERWLKDGLKGGEDEFMPKLFGGRPYEWTQHGQIGNGEGEEDNTDTRPKVKRMVLGSKGATYVCLLPSATRASSSETSTPPTASPHPAASWQLLEPLNGKCFYLRQGWFTYSYCHNDQVRQFREMAHAHPHPTTGRTPEEDPEYEAYTLGVSPARKAQQAELAVSTPLNQNLELRGTGQRYLVQRWGDGTACDKTGRPREIEIQFHCSMTTTDGIFFVKETRTCQYVLILQTPRLCSEPGFRSERESEPVNAVRCREVVDNAPSRFLGSQTAEDSVPGAPGSTVGLPEGQKAARIGKPRAIKAGQVQYGDKGSILIKDTFKGPDSAKETKPDEGVEAKAGTAKKGGGKHSGTQADMLRRAMSLMLRALRNGDEDGEVQEDVEGDGEPAVVFIDLSKEELEDLEPEFYSAEDHDAFMAKLRQRTEDTERKFQNAMDSLKERDQQSDTKAHLADPRKVIEELQRQIDNLEDLTKQQRDAELDPEAFLAKNREQMEDIERQKDREYLKERAREWKERDEVWKEWEQKRDERRAKQARKEQEQERKERQAKEVEKERERERNEPRKGTFDGLKRRMKDLGEKMGMFGPPGGEAEEEVWYAEDEEEVEYDLHEEL